MCIHILLPDRNLPTHANLKGFCFVWRTHNQPDFKHPQHLHLSQSSQTSSIINGEIGTWALSTWHGHPYREERNQLELQISLYRLWKKPGGLAQTSCRCLYVVRKTHSSTPKVTTAVWARIMLAACLYSAFKPMDGSTLKKKPAWHCCYSYS